MFSKIANVPTCEEEVLLDYAERLSRYREGRRAVYVHLSRLQPGNRQPHHRRVAASIFEILIKSFNGALFRIFNDDLVVILQGATVAAIDDCILRLRYLFSDDPLLAGHEDEGAEFCTWYDIESSYPNFLAMAQEAVSKRRAFDEERRSTRSAQQDEKQKEKALIPLDPANLALIIRAIEQADLSTKMRRQSICALTGSAPPKTVFREVFVSIDDLRSSLLPQYDLTASRGLFQELTRHIDRCLLRALAKNDDATLSRCISVNLNIETLTTPDFMDFDGVLSAEMRQTMIIELQLVDVMADFETFIFAREMLKGRGYRLCLEGVSNLTLPYVDRESMGFDLLKLQWDESMAGREVGHRFEKLKEVVARQSVERVIMNRCGDQTAIEFGQSLGIQGFQGFEVDRLLAAAQAA